MVDWRAASEELMARGCPRLKAFRLITVGMRSLGDPGGQTR
jgi:hypothetical protein